MARNTQESIHYLSRGSEQRQVLWLHHSASHPSSHNAARIAACVSFCRAPRRASSNCFRTACHHGSSRKSISTRVSIKAPMSSNLLRTRSPPGALAFSLIGSKCSSAIGCKPRRPRFIHLAGQSTIFRGRRFRLEPARRRRIFARCPSIGPLSWRGKIPDPAG